MIYIASDKYGFGYKQEIKDYLANKGYKTTDLGPRKDEIVDFPKYAHPLAKAVVSDPYNRGILFSGTGIGMCIAANKVKGAYAALVYNEKLAEKAREENDSNVLCLPSNFLSVQSAKEVVAIWLSTSFSGTEESARHIKQIIQIEKNG